MSVENEKIRTLPISWINLSIVGKSWYAVQEWIEETAKGLRDEGYSLTESNLNFLISPATHVLTMVFTVTGEKSKCDTKKLINPDMKQKDKVIDIRTIKGLWEIDFDNVEKYYRESEKKQGISYRDGIKNEGTKT